MFFVNQEDLFKANNHSKFDILWKKTQVDVEMEIKSLLKENYGITEIVEIFQVDEWEKMSNNYLIVSKHGGNITKNLLRRHILISEEEKLRLIGKISSHLISQNVPTPYIVPTVQGGGYFFSNSQFWQLFEFVNGEHYKGTIEQLKNIAQNIALIHKAFVNISFEVGLREKTPRLMGEWKCFFELAKNGKTKLDSLILENQSFLIGSVQEVNDLYYPDIPTMQPIHGDLHPQNTIYRGNQLVALLDFADVGLSERARDAGSACHRFVRQFIVNQGKLWQKELAKGVGVFLKYYNAAYPLTVKETQLMPILIMDEILRKLYVGLNDYYINGDAKHIENGEFEKKVNLLKEAEIIGKMISVL